ncbi:hypothetical protein LCGC14_2107340 [marine sediment metagenome]|uniref:Uncharacterized protein n=1 Tax=marine sediment metagenome TaxID=412755 RepID=A0A0F9GLA2_9ZZZZ
MPTFKDDKGRDWRVHVDLPAIVNVREIDTEEPIDLGSLKDMASNNIRMGDDTCLLCAVLFVVCEEQAKERELDYVKFSKLILGDVIEEATLALEEATISFFPQSRRSLLQRLQKKVNKVQEAGMNLVSEKLDSPDLEARILATMRETMDTAMNESLTPLSSATNSPESSA